MAKDGIVGGDAQVAEQVQHLAAADGVARHEGDHHLGQAADQPLQVEHVEPGQARLIDVAAIAAHALVAAGAKGPAAIVGRPGARQQHHPHGRIITHPRKGVAELLNGAGPEGVALVGAVDRDAGDPFASR